MAENEIYIKGARVHNLKNIELRIPHNKLVVITGLSGSGKSTLAFDTIFAEGQRRYVESLSSYARQFLGKIEKPDVDSITGIAPAIAVEQKVNTRNPRSTVGTTTEIYDYLRLLFSRIGHTYSPLSGHEVVAHTVQDIVSFCRTLSIGDKVMIVSPLTLNPTQGVIEKLTLLLRDGFQRVVINQEIRQIEDVIGDNLDTATVLIDRFIVSEKFDNDMISRLNDSIQRAFEIGDGACQLLINGSRTESFSSRFELDGMSFELPTEHLFSFNNPYGACPRCEGYGKVVGIDENLVIPDKSRTIYDDAIVCWRGETMRSWKEALIAASSKSGIPIHRPYYDLTREEKMLIWTGNEYFNGLNAFFEFLEKERFKIQFRVMLSRYTGKSICPECHGGRLRIEAGYVKIADKTIVDLVMMPIDELLCFFNELKLDNHDSLIAHRLLIEITSRLQYLLDVGLSYLNLDRQSSTLSGGESQRINLATSLGSSLVGSLYILDEPSIGLHPRDTHRLIKVLRQLRDLGNTVIVVEHEQEIIMAADLLIDIGPLAGVNGGEVVFCGSIDQLPEAVNRSLTARYILGYDNVAEVTKPREWKEFIEIKGARQNNLKNIDVKIPLGVMTCITGVSGSGKSSLVGDILYPALRRELIETGSRPGDFASLEGAVCRISAVELIDQNPIGKSSRSNPVTYIKAYDEIRKIFADQPIAKHNHFDSSSFSFNIAGGRCEECKGEGVIQVSMQFMADIELTCEACNGRRFKESVLDVKYQSKSIYDILQMSIDEAVVFFGNTKDRLNQKVVEKLSVLQDVGLGYIKLGQSSSTLSGGESQRVKLASFLLKDNPSNSILFIFDEPTTGLHFHDIRKLLQSFNVLIANGHTIVIVEHNMDVIKCADWIIDLGAEGGEKGGYLVFAGVPDQIIRCPESYTGQFLKTRI